MTRRWVASATIATAALASAVVIVPAVAAAPVTTTYAGVVNASVLVAGPFHDVIGTGPSYNSNPEQNYADIWNLTCPITPRVAQQLVGPGAVDDRAASWA